MARKIKDRNGAMCDLNSLYNLFELAVEPLLGESIRWRGFWKLFEL